jgi:FKBP-type peptidyl-prolyl cis-trans isomerase FkpA
LWLLRQLDNPITGVAGGFQLTKQKLKPFISLLQREARQRRAVPLRFFINQLKMKFYVTLFFAVTFLAFSCSKETCAEEAGLISMDQYIADNNLTFEDGEFGMRYTIVEPGGSAKPLPTAEVTVRYEGRQTNDEIFDQTVDDARRFRLDRLIGGWQIGIPLVGEGGKITLYLPSALAYGPGGTDEICPDSELIFDIELVSFIN